jgi:plastocyanin
VAVLALALALTLTACSNQKSSVAREPHTGSSTAASVDGIQKITVEVDDRYRFNPSTITVHPGKVEIILVHKGTGAPHDWQLVDFPADAVPLTDHGQTKMASFTAPSPGRYQFVCTIHIAQGQTGTLVVLPN